MIWFSKEFPRMHPQDARACGAFLSLLREEQEVPFSNHLSAYIIARRPSDLCNLCDVSDAKGFRKLVDRNRSKWKAFTPQPSSWGWMRTSFEWAHWLEIVRPSDGKHRFRRGPKWKAGMSLFPALPAEVVDAIWDAQAWSDRRYHELVDRPGECT